MSRLQHLDLGGDGVGLRHILEGKIVLQKAGIHPEAAHGLVKQERLHLRSKHQSLIRDTVVHRLDAEGIPPYEDRLLHGVVDEDGEHSPKPGDEFVAVLPVKLHDDLDLGVGAEFHTLLHKRGTQIPVVIDLTVEHCGIAPVLRSEGLVAGVQIDDGQPPEGNAKAVPDDILTVVGAAVPDGGGHLVQKGLVVIRRITVKHSNKSAQNTYFLSCFRPQEQENALPRRSKGGRRITFCR